MIQKDLFQNRYDNMEISEIAESELMSPTIRRGRKTSYEKAILIPYLRKYFNMGFSAFSTCQFIMEEKEIKEKKVSISERMVRNYFKGWAHQLYTEKNKDFIQNEKEVKNRFALAVDLQLADLYNIREDINSELQSYKEQDIPITAQNGMYRLRGDLAHRISEILKLKLDVEIEPAIDEEIEAQIGELVRKEKERLYR